MTEYPCPACGAPVRFQSRISIFSVCPFCSQMLVRRDLDVEAIGKMAILPEDSSPLQVGTEGKFDGRNFTLLGRLRQQWRDGNWNEWFALFADSTHGWLGEAQGFYSMSFEKNPGEKIPPTTSLIVGQNISLGGVTYEVDDIKLVTCVGSQGELPFRAPQGRTSTSVDLTGPSRAYACLSYAGTETHAYTGKYLEFEDFDFKNLRQIDGW